MIITFSMHNNIDPNNNKRVNNIKIDPLKRVEIAFVK